MKWTAPNCSRYDRFGDQSGNRIVKFMDAGRTIFNYINRVAASLIGRED